MTMLWLALLALCAAPRAAQQDESLLPEQSAAKAKAILQQAINVLGGTAFLGVRDSDCNGQLAQIGHNNELMGYTDFHDQWIFPDKNRTEYIVKSQNSIAGFLLGVDTLDYAHGGTVATVYNGDHGWMLDKGGVSDQPDDSLKAFREQAQSLMNNVLRVRRSETGIDYRYGGPDIVDLKEAEWVEITDSEHREFRMAVEKSTHLPLRWSVTTHDPVTRESNEVISSYAQFKIYDGVRTHTRISKSENGREVSQVTLNNCKYNSNLSPDLFTRTSLEQHAAQAGSKAYKNSKNKDKNGAP
jgi:hypothetical protein